MTRFWGSTAAKLQPGSTTAMRFLPDPGSGVILAGNADAAKNLDKILTSVFEIMLTRKNSGACYFNAFSLALRRDL